MEITNPDSIYFTSDTHFGSDMIIGFCRGQFSTAQEMDAELIRRWNETVPEDATVFHLGDFCDGPDHMRYLSQLNGRIYLISGNHDKVGDGEGFAAVTEQATVYIDGQRIILNHYPMLCFGGERTCTWQLFGHVHSGPGNSSGHDLGRLGMLFPRQYDVGVDNNDMRPVSYNELKNIIERQIQDSDV